MNLQMNEGMSCPQDRHHEHPMTCMQWPSVFVPGEGFLCLLPCPGAEEWQGLSQRCCISRRWQGRCFDPCPRGWISECSAEMIRDTCDTVCIPRGSFVRPLWGLSHGPYPGKHVWSKIVYSQRNILSSHLTNNQEVSSFPPSSQLLYTAS